MAEPTGNITGEGGVSSWLTPELVSSLIQTAPGIFQAIQGGKQTREAEKMQKALGPRVNYTIPESAKRALGVAEDLARPREMAGQNLMQYMLEQERSKTLAQAMRGLSSPQDVAALAAQQAETGQAGQLQLGAAAAQDYTARQQALGTALGTMAGYEDKVTADKQIDWYERAKAAAAMKGAGLQNKMGALQGLTQAAAGFLATDAAKNLFGGIGAPPGLTTNRQTNKKVDEANMLSSDGEEGVIDPADYVAPGMTDKQMLEVTGMNNTGGFNYSTPTPPQLFPQSSTPFLNMTQKIGQQMYGTGGFNPSMPYSQTPNYIPSPTPTANPMSGQQMMSNLLNMGLTPGVYTNPADIKAQNAAALGQIPSSITDMLNIMMSQNGLKLY
jgi:hypothetical protein